VNQVDHFRESIEAFASRKREFPVSPWHVMYSHSASFPKHLRPRVECEDFVHARFHVRRVIEELLEEEEGTS
jgi:hypothetical protein